MSIDLSKFPKIADPDLLESHASKLKSAGSSIHSTAADSKSKWHGLTAVYEAPEASVVFGAFGPIESSASDVKSATATAESALSAFAGKARDIKTRYQSIAGDVSDFNSSIEGDDDWNKDEDKVNKEHGLLHDLDVLLADYEAAQQECANKISAIYGGPKLTSFSNDSTSAKGHYAMTA
ncbi:hypothetical protein, partial [Spelaeicoccus albus]